MITLILCGIAFLALIAFVGIRGYGFYKLNKELDFKRTEEYGP